MGAELKSLLQRIEQGHFEDIPQLAEWLKIQGDPRADGAWEATVFEPHEIAEELVKVRSVRQSYFPFISFLAEIGLLGLFGVSASKPNLSPATVESAPTIPRWWRPSAKKCLVDVEKARQTNVVPTDVSRAMTIARRLKADRLLALFSR